MSEDITLYGGHPPDAARVNELRAHAAALGWSQRETARRLGFDDRETRYWFTGKKPVPIGVLFAFRYLNTAEGRGEIAVLRVADQAAESR